jgi:hypothetical protein
MGLLSDYGAFVFLQQVLEALGQSRDSGKDFWSWNLCFVWHAIIELREILLSHTNSDLNFKRDHTTHFFTPNISSTLSNMSQPAQKGTRAKNADTHPGAIIPTRKRRTKAEMERDRQAEAAASEQNEHKKKQALQRIAKLEDRMAVDDEKAKAVPAQRPRPRPLRRTGAHAVIPLYADEVDEADEAEAVADDETYHHGDTDIEEKQPKKKRKAVVRDTIQAIRKGPAAGVQSSQPEKVGEGKKGTPVVPRVDEAKVTLIDQ